MRSPTVAVIVPAWREPDIGRHLARLQTQATPADAIVIVHANDPITVAALAVVDRGANVSVLFAAPGRASQMNCGANACAADVLLFLHADTELSPGAIAQARAAVAAGALWGWFRVRLSGAAIVFRVIEFMMNWRARLTGIATGDSALFVRADVFRCIGGFPAIELMEDIELSARLKSFGRPTPLCATVVTSSRRWQRHGIARTVLRMWCLRALYACGVSPRRLAAWYR